MRARGGKARTASAAADRAASADRVDRTRAAQAHPRSAAPVRRVAQAQARRVARKAPMTAPSDPAASPASRPSARRRLHRPQVPPRPHPLVRHSRLPPSGLSPRHQHPQVRSVLQPRNASGRRQNARGPRLPPRRPVRPRLPPRLPRLLLNRQRLRLPLNSRGRRRTAPGRSNVSGPAAPTARRIPTGRAASGRRRCSPSPHRLRLRRLRSPLLRRPLPQRPLQPAPSRCLLLPQRRRRAVPSRCRLHPRLRSKRPCNGSLSRPSPAAPSRSIRRASASRICAASAASGGTAIG